MHALHLLAYCAQMLTITRVELKSIIKSSPTGMLTTRDRAGALHSRAMRPTQWENLTFVFVFNNASHKGVRFQRAIEW